MHLILSLYDAPVPAQGAVAALKGAGVGEHDIAIVPLHACGAMEHVASAQASPEPNDPKQLSLPSDPGELSKALVSLGVALDDAQTCGEGVRRGAILLLARVPTLHAPSASAELDRFGAVSLEAHRARWEHDQALRYGWSATHAPDVVGPAASEE